MLGAIAGDIIGSPHEFKSLKTTDFPLFVEGSRFTDDTVLTLATAFSLLTDGNYAENYRIFGRLYPLAGYGGRFADWLAGEDTAPYGSFGNGSARSTRTTVGERTAGFPDSGPDGPADPAREGPGLRDP